MRALLVASVLIAVVARSAPLSAQVRHRRPMPTAPDVRYGFDNNGGSGCRDYNCGARCYDGHSGTDFSVAVGTSVIASADGVVTATNNGCANVGYVGNPCGGRCGNYVQLEHSDGSRTIYCHMQLNSLAVSRGQRVRCGQTLGRSASSGSSSGPHLHFGWRRTASAASADSFRGRCTSAPGVWTDQRAYPQSPADTCACVPATEVCNGRDDDCDGRVDDVAARGCYTGPAGTSGRGVCRAGTQACARGAWAACTGQTVPRAETCNRMDDDCDGRVDDGVCVMDASVAPDAALRDAAVDRADVTDRGALTDLTSERTVDAPIEADAEIDAEVDAEVDADAMPDAEFVDDAPPPPDGDEVAPDQPVQELEGGCGCHGAGARGRGGASALALVALIGMRLGERSRRRRASTDVKHREHGLRAARVFLP